MSADRTNDDARESAARVRRLIAFGELLTSAAPSRAEAHMQWYEFGSAWLRLGDAFAAVAVSAPVVHQAVGRRNPQDAAGPLAEALDGPVFYRPQSRELDAEYTVLLSVEGAASWAVPFTRRLGAYVWVPAPGRHQPSEDGGAWWVVAGTGRDLCTAQRLRALVARGTTDPALCLLPRRSG